MLSSITIHLSLLHSRDILHVFVADFGLQSEHTVNGAISFATIKVAM